MKKLATGIAVGAAAIVAMSSIAGASVTFDSSTGTGFVGKGDVQTALGYNNAQMQANANSLTFTYSQPATQALSQDATQAGTQVVTEDLTCGNNEHNTRQGTRDGSRDGNRSGNRAGIQSGSLSSSVAYDARTHRQVDGFNLTGFSGAATFVPSGSPTWGGWSFGEWTWGAVTWGAWSNPNMNGCNGLPVIDDVIAYGDVIPGDIIPGAISYGAISPSGSATLYVNGVALG